MRWIGAWGAAAWGVAALSACSTATGTAAGGTDYRGGDAQLSRAADASMLVILAASYIAGSTPEERAQAYDDYRATAGHDAARKNRWFEREADRHQVTLAEFRIDQSPVTNAAYAEFVADTGTKAPFIDAATWNSQGFVQQYPEQVTRYNWTDGHPPIGREDHPVVLVTWDEADAYCRWRGSLVGAERRLPTADEYERAARGGAANVYPWGNEYDSSRLNSQVAGPLDTVAVGSYPDGASEYGMLDAAGNVFQWTSTEWPHKPDGKMVKGSAWDDYAGVGRGASGHGRRRWVRHVIVGFRCAG